eukprot:4411633-Amphidinium_carterae.1
MAQSGGWRCGDHYFTWCDADHRVKWYSSRVFCAEMTMTRFHFAGLETGLSTQSFRHLKKALLKQTQVFGVPSTLPLEAFGLCAFSVGDLCVRCHEEVEDLSHIRFLTPGTKNVARSNYRLTMPVFLLVLLHGSLPAPHVPPVIHHVPALVYRAGVHTVWTVLDATTVIRTTEGVALATTLTSRRELGHRSLA